MAIERNLPHSEGGYQPWHPIADPAGAPPKEYYIPGEVCDPIGRFWFYFDNDPPRSDGELLGMRLICRARKANLLLNVPPDRHGVIPDEHVKALTRLHQNLERVGV
jgi:hypothetical protein